MKEERFASAEDPLHAALTEIRPAQDDASAESLRAAVRRRLFGAVDEPDSTAPGEREAQPARAGEDDPPGPLRGRIWLGAALLLGLIALLCAVEALRSRDLGELTGSE